MHLRFEIGQYTSSWIQHSKQLGLVFIMQSCDWDSGNCASFCVAFMQSTCLTRKSDCSMHSYYTGLLTDRYSPSPLLLTLACTILSIIHTGWSTFKFYSHTSPGVTELLLLVAVDSFIHCKNQLVETTQIFWYLG